MQYDRVWNPRCEEQVASLRDPSEVLGIMVGEKEVIVTGGRWHSAMMQNQVPLDFLLESYSRNF